MTDINMKRWSYSEFKQQIMFHLLVQQRLNVDEGVGQSSYTLSEKYVRGKSGSVCQKYKHTL